MTRKVRRDDGDDPRSHAEYIGSRLFRRDLVVHRLCPPSSRSWRFLGRTECLSMLVGKQLKEDTFDERRATSQQNRVYMDVAVGWIDVGEADHAWASYQSTELASYQSIESDVWTELDDELGAKLKHR
ncbi:hypothetical protein ACLOJK_007374 [Asimina triloba]